MDDRLRIAELAPVAMPVRPGEGDSIEQLVSLLTEELVRRGHDVTLFATGDSVTTAELRSCYAHGYRESKELWDWRVAGGLSGRGGLGEGGRLAVVHRRSHHLPPALP